MNTKKLGTKIVAALVAVLAALLFAGCEVVGAAEAEQAAPAAEPLHVGALKGPTGMGLAYVIAEDETDTVELFDAPDVAAGAKAKGMAPELVRIFEKPAAIAPWAAELVRKGELARGDWIFVKGSRGMRMEGFIEALEQELDQTKAGGGHAV